MKSVLRLLSLAATAAALHFLIIAALMFTGVGPFGHGRTLLRSGALNTYSDANARDWFRTAERSGLLDHFILWPLVLLGTALLAAWLVPKHRWWHSLVIAGAVLPLDLPYERVPLCSPMSQWAELLREFLLYALLVAVLSYIVRAVLSKRSKEIAA